MKNIHCIKLIRDKYRTKPFENTSIRKTIEQISISNLTPQLINRATSNQNSARKWSRTESIISKKSKMTENKARKGRTQPIM